MIVLLTLVIMLIILSLSATCLMMLPNEILLTRNQSKALQALYLSEAGAEYGLQHLLNDAEWLPNEVSHSLGEGHFQLTTIQTPFGKTIVSTGWVPIGGTGKIIRKVLVTLRLKEINDPFRQAVTEQAEILHQKQWDSGKFLPNEIKETTHLSPGRYYVAGDLVVRQSTKISGKALVYVAGEIHLEKDVRVGIKEEDCFLLLAKQGIFCASQVMVRGILYTQGNVYLESNARIRGAVAAKEQVFQDKYAQVIYDPAAFYSDEIVFSPIFQIEDWQYLRGR